MFRKIVLALSVFVLALGVAELAVRVADLRITSLHRGLIKYGELEQYDSARNLLTGPANTNTLLFGHDAHFNSFGMRDREPVVPKPKGVFRVLLLGDSMTFAQGVAWEHSYVSRLRQLFVGDSGRSDLDIAAAGVPGWNTVDEEQFLDKYQSDIDPDLVVLLYVDNDNEPLNPFLKSRSAPDSVDEQIYRYLLLHSRLFEWSAYIYQSRIGRHDGAWQRQNERWVKLVASQGQPYSRQDKGWLQSRAALLRIKNNLEDKGARLVVFVFDLGAPPRLEREKARLNELALSSGLAVYDTLPFFTGHDPYKLMNSPVIDPHPNALGHQLLAAGIAETLLDEGLVTQ